MMSTYFSRVNRFNAVLAYPAERLQSLTLLGMRLYVSWMFFPAGLSKVEDWGATMFLFEFEYQVPLLSPMIAAWLGTLGELLFPALLTLGLFSRFSAAGLFVLNAVAVISLSVIQPAALAEHLLWGGALLVVMLWGSGRLSVDALLSQRERQCNAERL
ncbi:DoxX family protein [Spongiibacter tropicus]|uniref:DoxX family protein n=1 Tax=Spongiibacter tropicus TaxID=454602 RepID=UPI0024E250E5|nr:DoxX family protein [Spongiibacter tropicus]